MPFEYLFLTSVSSIWFWLFLAMIWYFSISNVFGVPYRAWFIASNNEDELADLCRFTRFIAAHFTKKYRILNHWCYILIIAFLITFIALTGFLYESEFLQLSLFVFVPIIALIHFRLNLAKKFIAQQLMPSELHIQIFLNRRKTKILGFLSLITIFCWFIFTIIKHQTI